MLGGGLGVRLLVGWCWFGGWCGVVDVPVRISESRAIVLASSSLTGVMVTGSSVLYKC